MYSISFTHRANSLFTELVVTDDTKFTDVPDFNIIPRFASVLSHKLIFVSHDHTTSSFQ